MYSEKNNPSVNRFMRSSLGCKHFLFSYFFCAGEPAGFSCCGMLRQGPGYDRQHTMKTILVIYHSQGGTTERMARAVADGAAGMEGACALLKRLSRHHLMIF